MAQQLKGKLAHTVPSIFHFLYMQSRPWIWSALNLWTPVHASKVCVAALQQDDLCFLPWTLRNWKTFPSWIQCVLYPLRIREYPDPILSLDGIQTFILVRISNQQFFQWLSFSMVFDLREYCWWFRNPSNQLLKLVCFFLHLPSFTRLIIG